MYMCMMYVRMNLFLLAYLNAYFLECQPICIALLLLFICIGLCITVCSPLSRRLSWPPAAICAKPASRPQKFRLSRELAEKNIRLSRRENSGLNAKKIHY